MGQIEGLERNSRFSKTDLRWDAVNRVFQRSEDGSEQRNHRRRGLSSELISSQRMLVDKVGGCWACAEDGFLQEVLGFFCLVVTHDL